MKALRAVSKALSILEKYLLMISLTIMLVTCFAQVVNRNIFQLPINWFEEVGRYCMIYMGLVAGAVGLREGTQVSVSLFVDRFPKTGKIVVAYIDEIIMVAYGIFMFIASLSLIQNQIKSGQLTPALQIPMAIPYLAVLLCFLLIMITQIERMINKTIALIKYGADGLEKAELPEATEE